MKNIATRIILLILIIIACRTEVKANHAAGGEISYEWISDSTYRIYFKFYRDCTGPDAPTTVPLCYRNTCNSLGGTVTLSRILKLPDSTVNGLPVTLGCPGTGTKCTNTTSVVPGYTEWWYTNTITLPSRCNFWRFSTYISARNASVNLVNAASTNFYAEATLNNVVAQGNSSPYFSVKPVPSICINQPYTYNNGGVDPNSDSLSFVMAQPLQTSGACPPVTSVVTYVTASPVYNLTTNPIQTGNTFHLDSSNGQMTFTPTLAGASTMTVRINEYRNGVWIGSVMRDIQVQVIACSVTAPIVNTVSTSISGGTYVNGRVEACSGVPISFCYDLKSSNSSAVLVASDNHTAAAPGSTVTYTGQRTDSIRGCFYWTPSTLDTGLRVFSVSAKDSTCVSPGVAVTQTFVLPIYIWPITDIIKDTTICYGDSVMLTAVGGSNFTWSVISGGSPITTLSCTTCKQPYARPLLNTQYIVSNSVAQYCSKNRDTVSVNVLDIRYDTLSATNNSPVCQGTTLNLYSSSALSGYGYKWTGPNSFTSTSQNPTIASITALGSGNYILKSSKNGCYSLPDTTVVVAAPTPSAPVLSNNGPVCQGSQLDISAQTVSGGSYSWSGPNSYTSTSQYNSIVNAQPVNGGTYTATVTVNGCTSASASTIAVVNPKPVISYYSSVNPSTCNGTNGSITLNGLSNSTSYSVGYKKNGITQTTVSISSNGTGSLTLSGLGAGSYSSIILTLNGCASDSTGPIVLNNPATPIAVASNNTPVCQGDTIKLYGISDSSGVTWAWTGPNSYSSAVQNPVIVNSLPIYAGVYTLTATKNNCTSVASTTTVVVNTIPATPVAGSNSPLCSGATLNLSSSTVTGATYSWTGPNSYTSTTQAPSIVNADTTLSGNYVVRATVNGCVSLPATAAVVVYHVPSIATFSYNHPSTCSGTQGSITLKGLSGNTGYTVNYKKNGTAQSPLSLTSDGAGDVLMSGLSAGSYTQVSVTRNNCTSDTLSPIVLRDPLSPVVSVSNNTPVCQGDTMKLYGTSDSSGVTWSWTGPASYTSSIQNPIILNALPAISGVYTLTATKNNCTSIAATTTVTVYPTPTTPVAGSNSPLCSGSVLNLTSSTVAGATYSWTGPNSYTSSSQNPNISNVDTPISGRYIVIATVNNCVSAPDTETVIVYHVPDIDTYAYSHPTTCSGTQGAIILKGLLNNTGYTVNYKKNGISQTALPITSNASGEVLMSGLSAGLYTEVTVMLNNCTSDTIQPVLLRDPLAPVVTANNNTPICETDTLRLFSTSDSSSVIWSWTGPNSYTSSVQNPVILNSLPAYSGVYRITATKNNCTSVSASTTVVVHPTPVKPIAGSNSPLCSGSVLNLTSSTVSGATYSWTGPNSYTSSNQNPSIVNVDTPISGKYVVHATANGCESAYDTIRVVVYHVPAIATYSYTHPTTCGGAQGSITLKGLLSNTIYTVNYKRNGSSLLPLSLTSNGSGDVLISGLSAALYSQITVTLNNCTSDTISPIILHDPSAPVVIASNNTPVCQLDTVRLYGSSDSSGVVWSWSGPNSYVSANQNPVIVNALPAMSGIYTLAASKNNCTSATVTTSVLVHPTPVTPLAGNNSPLCSGSVLNLTATNVTGATYNWRGPNSYTSPNQNPSIANVDTPISGNYIVTATVNNCLSEPDTTTVIVYHVPAVGTYSYSHPTTCGGLQGSITLKGLLNNTTYVVNYKKNGVSQSALSISSNGSGDVLMGGLSAGLYSQITVMLNNCTSDTILPVLLHDPSAPVVTATNNTPVCQLDTLRLYGSSDSSGVTWSWSGPNSYISVNQNPVILNALPAMSGIYTLTASKNNCTSAAVTTSVLVHPTPATPLAGNNSPLCSGSVLNLTASNVTGATYSWRGPNSYTSLNQNPSIANVDTPISGDYIVTATVNNCLSASDTTTVIVYHVPAIGTYSYSHPTTCSGSEGSITLKGLLNNTTYIVNYRKNGLQQSALSITSNGSGDILMSGLSAGLYSKITVTLNNCTSDTIAAILLSDPVPPVITIASTSNPTTCLGTEGYITLGGLNSGISYTINYKKNLVSQPAVSLTANISGRVTITGLTAGTYSNITATVNNCVSNIAGPVTLTDPSAPIVTASNNTPICQADTIKLYATSDSSGVTWSWTGPNSYTSVFQNSIITNALPMHSGQYYITATLHNCTSVAASTNVIVKPTPATPTATNNGPFCSGNTLILNAANVVGASYSWTGPNSYTSSNQNPTIANAQPLHSGNYTVIATVNGCVSASSSTAVTVYVLPAPIIGTYTVSHPTTCSGTDGSITLGGLANNASFTVNYKKNNVSQTPVVLVSSAIGTITISGLTAGIYTSITTTSTNGCTSDALLPLTLADPVPPVISVLSAGNPTTCLGNQGFINLQGLAPGISYVINYSKNSIAQTPLTLIANSSGNISMTGLSAALYSNIRVTVTNCVSNWIDSVRLKDPSAPIVFASNNGLLCPGDTLRLYATSDSSSVNWSWTGPNSYASTSQYPVISNAQPALSGVYSVTANKNNCTSLPATVTVLVNPTPPTPVAGNNSPLCSGSTLNLSSSTVTNASYSWTGPNSYSSSSQNPVIVNVDTPRSGNYIVTARVNGCVSAGDTTTVIVYHVPAIGTYSYSHPTTCTGAQGSITLKGLLNNTTYVVSYKKNGISQSALSLSSNGSGDVLMSGLSAGLYAQITVMLNNCTSDTIPPILLHDPSAPVLSANSNTPICQTDTLKLFGTSDSSGVVWSWTGPNVFSSALQNPVIPNALPLHSGTYILSAVKNNCTSLPVTTTVVVHPTPVTPLASNNGPLCTGATLNLSSSTITGATYYWTGPNSYISSAQNPSISNVDTPISGKYIVRVSVNGCFSAPDTTIVNVYDIPSIGSYSFTHPTTCGGTQGTITLRGLRINRAYVVTYLKNTLTQPPLTITSNGFGEVLISGLSAGNYTQLAVTLNGCTSPSVSPIALTDPNAPIVTATNNTPVCQGDTIRLYASSVPGVTYSWSGPVSFSSTLQNPVLTNALPTQSGTYSVTATLNNCVSIPAVTTVLVHPTPPTPIASANSPLCERDSLKLSSVFILYATYSWTGPNSFVSSLQNPNIINAMPIHSGIYTVKATVNGCVSASSSTTVVVNPLPTPTTGAASVTNPSVCNGANGSITVNGLLFNTTYSINYKKNAILQGPFTFTSNAAGGLVITGLTAGTYTSISVKAPTGCVSDTLLPKVLTDPLPPSIALNAFSNPTTCLGSQGTITISGLVSTISYTVNYSKNSISQPAVVIAANASGYVILSGLSAGVYSNISVTINSCISNVIGPVTLSDPAPPTVTTSSNSPLCQGDTLRLNAVSTPGATYIWAGPASYSSTLQSPVIINALPASSGKYYVKATINNCTSLADTVDVLVKPRPATPTAGNNGPLCAGDTLKLSSPLFAAASYLWTGPNSYSSVFQNPFVPNAQPVLSGTYKIVVTVNGCASFPDSTLVTVNPIPSAPVVNSPLYYCQDQQSTQLTANAIGLLLWYAVPTGGISNVTAPTPSTVSAGSTTWFVSQTISGCESPRSALTVTVKPKPAIPLVSPATYKYCQDEKTLPLHATGTSLLWYTQLIGGAGTSAIPTPSSSAAGIFKWYVTQTGANGCESSRDSVEVTISPAIDAGIWVSKDIICAYDSLLIIDTGTILPGMSYKWDFNGGTIVSGDTSGPYLVTWNGTGTKTIKLNVSNTICNDSDKRTISVKPSPEAYFELKNDACVGEEILLAPKWILNASYLWSAPNAVVVDSNSSGYNIKWNLSGEQTIDLNVTSENGCVSEPFSRTVYIHDLPEAQIESISRNDVCTGDTISLRAESASGYKYRWSGEASFMENDRYEVTASVLKTGNLFLQVTNEWECLDNDTVFVLTHPCCDAWLPDAFSPNGDGKNDKFRVITVGHHAVMTFIIVNRWGQKIFETNNEKEGWDGTFNGTPLDVGAYYFYLKYKCSDDTVIEKKGQVMLVR